MTTYKVIRYYENQDRPQKVVLMGLTLQQAQAHCRHGDGWFDEYKEE
jgi:hypothetical protein